MYAIIATGGKQYKVAEGDVIRVEKLGVEAGETVTFDQVLAVSNDGLKVGEDVKNASVTASVVGNGKGKKVIVYKYKRKTGYHKSNGHAGYAEEGQDIICAAVSALIVNTVNSVETLTEDLIISEAGDGYVYFSFPNGYSESTALLVKSLLLGLESIRRDYGAQYLEIAFKEV